MALAPMRRLAQRLRSDSVRNKRKRKIEMHKFIMGCFVVAVLGIPTFAMAVENAAGTLTVTGTVASSISLTVETTDGTCTLCGTAAASLALGNISKGGAAPAGFTITKGGSSWTLTSPSGIGVMVTKANLPTSDVYTLSAKLGSVPTSGIVWTVGAITANATTIQTIGSGVAYGSALPYAWYIVIQDTVAPTTPIDNVIQFSAVSA
jgi:hypothetical protein